MHRDRATPGNGLATGDPAETERRRPCQSDKQDPRSDVPRPKLIDDDCHALVLSGNDISPTG